MFGGQVVDLEWTACQIGPNVGQFWYGMSQDGRVGLGGGDSASSLLGGVESSGVDEDSSGTAFAVLGRLAFLGFWQNCWYCLHWSSVRSFL